MLPLPARTALSVLAATLVAVGLTVLPPGAAAPADAAVSPPLSGAYVGGGDTAGVQDLERWRGRRLGIVTEYVDGSTWSTISSPTWAADRWKGRKVAWGVPMLPKSGGSMATGAAGGYDGYFRGLASTLVARGHAASVIRLGWEMNGTWYSWSAVKDPAAYVAYWRRAVTAMRSVSGSAFAFEWAPNLGEGTAGFDITRAYPGDAYVDVLGVSFYDQSWTWASTQVVERWNSAVTTRFGLQWHVDFARAHGKRNAFSEWALSRRCDGRGGNDNPYYVGKVADWATANGYLYESYFSKDMGSCEVHDVQGPAFPRAAAAYRQRFGGGPAATLATTALRVSPYTDRSAARTLDTAVLSGRQHIFLVPGTATSQVRFWLDDPAMTTAPRTTERVAPWDLAGGTATAANPIDVSALPPGTHTVTAAVDTSSGTKIVRGWFLR